MVVLPHRRAAQHSVPGPRRDHSVPDLWMSTRTIVVGLQLRCVRMPFGQSGRLHGLKLVPSKWRCLVPLTSG